MPVLQGYVHVKNHEKKITVQSDLFSKLAPVGHSDNRFHPTSKLCPKEVICPCPKATNMYKKICIKSHFKEISFKLASVGHSDKRIHLT